MILGVTVFFFSLTISNDQNGETSSHYSLSTILSHHAQGITRAQGIEDGLSTPFCAAQKMGNMPKLRGSPHTGQDFVTELA